MHPEARHSVVSDQLHVLSALTPRKVPLVPLEYVEKFIEYQGLFHCAALTERMVRWILTQHAVQVYERHIGQH